MDIGEAHIYLGLALLAAGLGIALNSVGVAMAIFGLGLIPIGIILSATAPGEEPETSPGQFEGMNTAAPVSEAE